MSNWFIKRILIAVVVIVLATFNASCNLDSDERSTSESTTGTEESSSSDSAIDPTRTPTLPATSEPISEPTSTPRPTLKPSPTPDIQKYVDLDLPEGDPLSGRNLAIRNGCRGCHFIEGYVNFAIGFTAGDGLPPIMERGEIRITDPKYTGKATTNLEYIFESIYLPELYVVEGDWVKAMPLNYDNHLADEQDLADLLAWMAALNDPEFEFK